MDTIPKSAIARPLTRGIDWSDLRFLLAVARTGNLSKAGVFLKMGQPAVTRRLDALEARLGAVLTIRSQRGVQLTPAGRFVAEHAATVERSIQTIEDQIASLDRGLAGEVAIICPDTLAFLFLGPALAAFQRSHPDIHLDIRAKPLSTWSADISIQYHETKRMDDVAVGLGWVHYLDFTTQEYIDLYGRPRSSLDAFQHKMATHVEYREQKERWRPKMQPLQDLIDPSLRTDCGPMLINAVASGAGVATLPSFAPRFFPSLVTLETGVIARARFWAVYDLSRGELPRIKTTVNWLKTVFEAAKNPWFREAFIRPDEFPAA